MRHSPSAANTNLENRKETVMNSKLLIAGAIGTAALVVSAGARPGGDRADHRPNPEDVVAEIVADYDANTDNLITSEELATAIVGMREKRISRMKERFDDSDRERPEHPRGDREGREPTEVAAKLVERFDENGDAALDTEELMGVVSALHREMGPKGKRGPGFRGKRGHRGGHDAPDDSETEA